MRLNRSFIQIFYLLAFFTYLERHINFSIYYDQSFVELFSHPLFLKLVTWGDYSVSLNVLKFLHALFLLGILGLCLGRLRPATSLLLFLINWLFLQLNYSTVYAVDIFLQIGFLFFSLIYTRAVSKSEKATSETAVYLLRWYLGLSYFISIVHKMLNFGHANTSMVQALQTLQTWNQVPESLYAASLDKLLTENIHVNLIQLIVFTQILGAGLLLRHSTRKWGSIVLIGFHGISILLLKLILFPLVAISLILVAGFSESFASRKTLENLKELSH